jgi:hypothetical protein
MPLSCPNLLELLASGQACEESPFGLKVPTHCLYPSAEPVYVHVAAWGEGFRVTDGGGISRAVFVHGRDETALRSGLSEASSRHSLQVEGGALFADVPNKDWLQAAILAVANGAALASAVALEHVGKRIEKGLSAKILEMLSRVVSPQYIAKDYEARGKSGKSWRIDYAVVQGSSEPMLVKGVSPHHTSISSNYTVFGDIGSGVSEHLCVYQRSLQRDDTALLRQVATLVPVGSLDVGARSALRMLN